jgi:hypothetical protein
MWKVARYLHGLVERLVTNIYLKGAYQLGAQSSQRKGIQIISDPTVLPKITSALDSIESSAGLFYRSVQANLLAIISAKGIATRTLPVTKRFLVDSAVLDEMDVTSVARLLVQSAAYTELCTKRPYFMPGIFFRKQNRRAKAEAKQIAERYQAAVTEGEQ